MKSLGKGLAFFRVFIIIVKDNEVFDMKDSQPIIIGVTGGSGSGKTSVSRAIFNNFPDHSIMMLEQDSYYKDQSHLSFEERLNTNYDHPFAFDTDLLIQHVEQLLKI